MTITLRQRITAGSLLIAVVGMVSISVPFYLATSRLISGMATSEISHLVDATVRMVHQSIQQTIVNKLRALSESNRDVVEHFYREYRAGRMSEAEARRRAVEVLGCQRVGRTGYLYCIDSKGVVQVHPRAELLHRDASTYDFVRTQMGQKQGYLEYTLQSPGETRARAKALYMTYFAPWDWIISAAAYRDEFSTLISVQDFRKDILAIRTGRTGYLYVMDGTGATVVNPAQAGIDLTGMRDTEGRLIIWEMLHHRSGQLFFWSRNLGETVARKRLVVYEHCPPFNWIIAGSADLDELYAPVERMRSTAAAVFILTSLLAVLLALIFGRGVVSTHDADEMALRASLQATQRIIDTLPVALVLVGRDQTIRRANQAAGSVLGLRPGELLGQPWARFVPEAGAGESRVAAQERFVFTGRGTKTAVLLSTIPTTIAGEEVVLEAFTDLTERRRLETELRHAQKLEAVGQLAAGIAHEINTPAQFVGDSLHFLLEAYQSDHALIAAYRRALASLLALPGNEALARQLREAEEAADSAYLEQHAPAAFERAIDGMSRITSIVGAMKEFGHRDQRERSPADLNRALKTTLTIARNEYKYVADVVTDFGDIPLVTCHASDMNQVFLNLLVNAAHAIAEAAGKDGPRGTITVRTATEGDRVRIDIRDTGCGIRPEIRDRVFEPFFTTKEVGKGTGQGLAIVHSIVVDRHRGSLTFASEVGRGTTFTVLLPIRGETELATAA